MNRHALPGTFTACAAALLLFLMTTTHAGEKANASGTPEELVESLYGLVSFAPGTTPDWARVKDLFLDDARLVLRVRPDSSAVFSVEAFVRDFQRFIDNSDAMRTGFQEKIVRTKSLVFGDVAQFTVLYEAHMPGTPRPPQQGVDCIVLSRHAGRWWIVAIVNEIPMTGRPLPPALRE